MEKRTNVLEALAKQGIPFEITEHEAVFTMEEMDALGITKLGDVCKNLFLRDAKGKVHYLVVLPEDKRADLKHIAQQLESTALSFASEKRLMEHLGLEKGAVTPFGVINDMAHATIVVFDASLKGKPRLGLHPNDNIATVWLDFAGLEKYIQAFGNDMRYITL